MRAEDRRRPLRLTRTRIRRVSIPARRARRGARWRSLRPRRRHLAARRTSITLTSSSGMSTKIGSACAAPACRACTRALQRENVSAPSRASRRRRRGAAPLRCPAARRRCVFAVERARVREKALFAADQVDDVELEPLRAVERRERHDVAGLLLVRRRSSSVSACKNAASAASCVASLPLAISRPSRLLNVRSSASTFAPPPRGDLRRAGLARRCPLFSPTRSASPRAATLACCRSMSSVLRNLADRASRAPCTPRARRRDTSSSASTRSIACHSVHPFASACEREPLDARLADAARRIVHDAPEAISSERFNASFRYARTSLTSLRSKNCCPPTTLCATPCSRSASSTGASTGRSSDRGRRIPSAGAPRRG